MPAEHSEGDTKSALTEYASFAAIFGEVRRCLQAAPCVGIRTCRASSSGNRGKI